MIKNKLKQMVVLILALSLIFSFSVCYADDEEDISTTSIEDDVSEEDISTTSDEKDVLESDLYMFSESNPVINQTVDGNAFIIGSNVTINSEIGGDAYILADTVTIEGGYVYSNLFICANSITINGIVYDMYACANTITIGENGYVYRDLHTISDSMTILGAIGRNANISANTLSFANDEGTNVGKIYGDLNYNSKTELALDESIVEGEINFNSTASDSDSGISVADYITSLLTYVLCVLVIYLLVMWLAPKFITGSKEILSKKIGASIGYGLLMLFVLPIFAVLILFLGITAKVTFALLLLYALLLVISASIFIVALTGIFADKLKIENKWYQFALSLAIAVVMWILKLIPVVGGLVGFVSIVLGLGIITKYVLPEKK